MALRAAAAARCLAKPWHQALPSLGRHGSLLLSRVFGSGSDDGIQDFHEEMHAVFGGPAASLSEDLPTCSAMPQSFSAAGLGGCAPTEFLSHVDSSGKAAMVDVSGKPETSRVAVASGKVLLGSKAFTLVAANQIKKGDVLTVAKLAGICGAKHTSLLIPLCHNIMLSGVDVTLSLDEKSNAVDVVAEARAVGPTGVEMEALTAVTVACLTIYDMCKAVAKDIQVSNIQLQSKTGGKSGSWRRE